MESQKGHMLQIQKLARLDLPVLCMHLTMSRTATSSA
jgi:hypothetical protein